MPAWEQLGMQAASQGISGALGLILAGINDRRQLRQQQKLQDMQIKGDKQLTDYNFIKQMEMWNNTNYPAQMAMLRKAGLNPALMYEGGGQGGSTAITQGNVAGATAPTGGGEIMQMMGMGLTRDLQLAQIENIKASTEKTKAEAAKTAGVDTQLAEQTIQGIKQTIDSQQTQQALTRAETALTELETKFQSETLENRKSLVNLQLSKLNEEVHIIENDRNISDETKQDVINTVRRQALQVYLENQLIKSQKTQTDQQTQVGIAEVKSIIAGIVQRHRQLDIEALRTQILSDKNFRDNMERNDITIDELLKNIGIIIPGPIGKGSSTPIRGFHQR